MKDSRHRGLEANALADGVASTGAGVSDALASAVAGTSGVVEASGGGGTRDVGLEPWTPEAGLDPKALLNLCLALSLVRSLTFKPPWSTFSFEGWFSFLNVLNASMRSSAVAWRIRPTLRVLRIRERRLRRAFSVGALERLPGSAGTAKVSISSSSTSSVSGDVGCRSTRL